MRIWYVFDGKRDRVWHIAELETFSTPTISYCGKKLERTLASTEAPTEADELCSVCKGKHDGR